MRKSSVWISYLLAGQGRLVVLSRWLSPANPSSILVTRAVTANCRFVCDDANKGLGQYKDSFDLVHVRCPASGIKDGFAFHHELPDVLRPGGILLVVLADYIHGEDLKIITQEDRNALVRAATP